MSLLNGQSGCGPQASSLKEFATREVASLTANNTIGQAAEVMTQRKISSLVITDKDNRPVGIVTERNILRAMQSNFQSSGHLEHVMSSPVITVDEDMDCQQAYHVCVREGIRHLVLVNGEGELSGVVSETDFRLNMNLEVLAGVRSVTSVMSRSVLTLSPQASLHEALNLMQAQRDTCVIAVEEGRPLGIVTERDVVRLFSQQERDTDIRINQVMSSPVVSISVDASLNEAAQLMLSNRTRHLAVINEYGLVAGLVGEHELTQNIAYDLAETLLDNKSNFLRTLINTIPDLVWLKDPKGTYLACNPAFERFFGSNEEQIIGKSDYDFVDSELADLFRVNDKRAIATGKPCTNDEWLTFSDGYRGLFDTINSPMYDHNGQLIGVLGVARDISVMHQAQEELKENERELQESLKAFNDLVKQVPVGVFKYRTREDGTHCFDYVSPRWCQLTGITANEAYQDLNSAFSWVHPDDLDDFQQTIADAIHSVQPFKHSVRIVQNDETRWLNIEAVPSRQANGDIVWDGIQNDITEHRKSRQHRLLTARVFTSTHEGIVITDANARIIEVNEAFSRITGYGREEVLGKNPSVLKSGHQDAPFYSKMWQSILEKGHWKGEVWNRRKSGEVYAEHLTISAVPDENGEVSHFVGVFADITPLKENEKKLEKIAHFDALTGVPNRTLLADRMHQAVAQCQRSGNLLAVCYLDLDGFKPVNDQYGHDVGDYLLVDIARRMQGYLRGGDTVARIGGDEFVLLMALSTINEVDVALNRMLEAIAKPMRIKGQMVKVSASIGVTLYPRDDAEPEALLRHADQAMYQAKQLGKNRYQIYDPKHEIEIRKQHESLQRLNQALEAHEFEMFYQPKVNLRNGQVIGVEALIRWHQPEQGILLPDEFLPHLIGTDLEIPLGEWVIESVLQQISQWKRIGLNLVVSINISAAHLLNPGFSQYLSDCLERYPEVSTDDLELEILESAAITDLEQASQVLLDGGTMGLNFSLDDFGTGYSSLSYFSKLPVGTLKIDQEFVRNMLTDPEDLSIVESVVFLAQAFNRTVIAEGVETPEHYAMLLHLGCPFGQGFGIAKPMPARQMQTWLDDWRSTSSIHHDHIKLPREDIVLMVAAASHREWIDKVVAYIEGSASDRPPMNPHQCRFGRWYHGTGQNSYAKINEYTALDPLHQQIHLLAGELVAFADKGQPDRAKAGIKELYNMRNSFLDGLDRLIERVMRESSY